MLYSGIFGGGNRRFRFEKSCGQTWGSGENRRFTNGDSHRRKLDKRYSNVIKLIILFAVFSVFCLIGSVERAVAADKGSDEKLSNAIESVVDGLDLTAVESAYGGVEFFGEYTAMDRIRAYISGQTEFSFSDIVGACIKLIFGNVSDFLPQIMLLTAICIFGCVIDAIVVSDSSSVKEVTFFVIIAVIVSVCASGISVCASAASQTIEALTKQIQAVFPVILTLMTACGGSSSVAVFQPSVAYLCAFESEICVKILFPIVYLIMVFGAIGCLSPNFKTGRALDFFKSLFKWITGATGFVFCFLISAKGIATSAFDGFSVKALKYVVGGGTPIVGQIVNGGFEVVFASCLLVKNSLGVFALVALILSVVSPILKIAILSLFFKFTSAVLEPISDERVVKFLGVSSDTLGYLSAVVISVTVVYLITLFIVICSLGGAL